MTPNGALLPWRHASRHHEVHMCYALSELASTRMRHVKSICSIHREHTFPQKPRRKGLQGAAQGADAHRILCAGRRQN